MNKYNPKIHHRTSIRLKGYDYSQAGLYFITICCQDRIYRFENVENRKMILNKNGIIAHNEWLKLSERFPNMEMDVFQIMPNHMHSIIKLVSQNDAGTLNNGGGENGGVSQNDMVSLNGGVSLNDSVAKNDAVSPDDVVYKNDGNYCSGVNPEHTRNSVSDIVGAYKSLVANACLDIYKSRKQQMGELWQRNYYEHIIQNEKSYHNISQYILNNPSKWTDDKFYAI